MSDKRALRVSAGGRAGCTDERRSVAERHGRVPLGAWVCMLLLNRSYQDLPATQCPYAPSQPLLCPAFRCTSALICGRRANSLSLSPCLFSLPSSVPSRKPVSPALWHHLGLGSLGRDRRASDACCLPLLKCWPEGLRQAAGEGGSATSACVCGRARRRGARAGGHICRHPGENGHRPDEHDIFVMYHFETAAEMPRSSCRSAEHGAHALWASGGSLSVQKRPAYMCMHALSHSHQHPGVLSSVLARLVCSSSHSELG